MLIVPLQPVPNQTLQCVLGAQPCTLRIYQRRTGVFMDLALITGAAPLVAGVACRDRTLIVRAPYLDFLGDLAFIDQQGNSDPTYDGLGSRFVLGYFPDGDAP